MSTAIVIENPAMLYAEPNLNTPVRQLPVGDKLELGAVKKSGGKQWVEVGLSDGRKGFVPGTTKVFSIKTVTLLQDGVDVHAGPSEASALFFRLQRNSRFDLVERVDVDGGTWVKVRDAAGNEGFIKGQTRIENVAVEVPRTRLSGLVEMGYGALLCLVGLVITAITFSLVAKSGGMFVIAGGPVVIGAWRFLKGLFRLIFGTK